MSVLGTIVSGMNNDMMVFWSHNMMCSPLEPFAGKKKDMEKYSPCFEFSKKTGTWLTLAPCDSVGEPLSYWERMDRELVDGESSDEYSDTVGASVSSIVKVNRNTVVVGCEDGKIRSVEFDVDSNKGQVGRILVGHKRDECICAIDFCPLKRLLASGSNDHTIKLWKFENEEKQESEEEDVPFQHSFCEEKSILSGVKFLESRPSFMCSGSFGGDLSIYDIEKLTRVQCYKDLHAGSEIMAIDFDQERNVIFSSDGEMHIKLFDFRQKKEIGQLIDEKSSSYGCFRSIFYLSKYHELVAGMDYNFLQSPEDEEKEEIWRFDLRTREVIKKWRAHEGAIRSVISLLPDHDYLCSCGDDSKVKVWNRKDGKLICTMVESSDVRGVSYLPKMKEVTSEEGLVDLNIRIDWIKQQLSSSSKGNKIFMEKEFVKCRLMKIRIEKSKNVLKYFCFL